MTEPTSDPATIHDWVGRWQSIDDPISAQQARFLARTFDHENAPKPGDRLPPLWYFAYFLDPAPTGGLGRDGHPARGGFIPPVELPRRMWAGGRFTFHGDLHVGEPARRTSTITDVRHKTGQSGELSFVTIEHRHTVDGDVRVVEEQDLVFREDPEPGAAPPPHVPAPDRSEWSRAIVPSEVLLFRYSALTFNAHRIHYDRDYALDVEGYPGLVVHGPLVATLLAELAETSASQRLATFSFRAAAPLFDTAPFEICGVATTDGADLWAESPGGGLAMTATATFR